MFLLEMEMCNNNSYDSNTFTKHFFIYVHCILGVPSIHIRLSTHSTPNIQIDVAIERMLFCGRLSTSCWSTWIYFFLYLQLLHYCKAPNDWCISNHCVKKKTLPMTNVYLSTKTEWKWWRRFRFFFTFCMSQSRHVFFFSSTLLLLCPICTYSYSVSVWNIFHNEWH